MHLLSFVLIFVFVGQMTEGRELTFCHTEMPPYSVGGVDGVSGIKVDILQDVVVHIEGVTAKTVLMPWLRCFAAVQDGDVDGVLPLFRNVEREDFLVFTDPVFEQHIRFWYRREAFPDSFEWSGDFNELAHLRLGLLNGGYLSAEMEAAFAGRDVVHANKLDSLMLMLARGRIDLFATDTEIGRSLSVRHGVEDQVAAIERPIISQPTQFGLSRASGASTLQADFNEAIRAWQAGQK